MFYPVIISKEKKWQKVWYRRIEKAWGYSDRVVSMYKAKKYCYKKEEG